MNAAKSSEVMKELNAASSVHSKAYVSNGLRRWSNFLAPRTIIGLFSSSVLISFSLITDPENALIIVDWVARNLAEVGHCAAKAALTSEPTFSFGRTSSVNGMVLVSGTGCLKLRRASLAIAREEVRGENIL